MRFKTVTKGKNQGEVVEYSAEEKVPIALQLAATESPEFEEFLVYIRDLVVKNLRYEAIGNLLSKKWQNNRYFVSGVATFHRRKIKNDQILQPRKWEFSLEFKDCLDEMGLPDIKPTKLSITT